MGYCKTNIACPLCKKSIVDMSQYESFYDDQIAMTQMPEEYKNHYMTVMCNDCLHKSEVKFHVMGGKCSKCKSYNTTQLGGLVEKKPTEQPKEEAVENENTDDEWEDVSGTNGEEERKE